MVKTNYTDGEIVPRLISTVLGDIYTTNCFGKANTSDFAVVDDGIEIDDSDLSAVTFAINKTTGYLDKVGGTNDANLDKEGPIFAIVKIYTMADGQPGVKLMRIK